MIPPYPTRRNLGSNLPVEATYIYNNQALAGGVAGCYPMVFQKTKVPQQLVARFTRARCLIWQAKIRRPCHEPSHMRGPNRHGPELIYSFNSTL
jgi:hypothetical protein